MLGEPGTDLKDSQLRALVDRLAVFDVTYLTGGSADADEVSPYQAPKGVNIDALVLDLTRAFSPRLRDALIALLEAAARLLAGPYPIDWVNA